MYPSQGVNSDNNDDVENRKRSAYYNILGTT